MFRRFVFLSILFGASFAHAQFTNVTAQVLDPSGTPYTNCRYNVDFVGQATGATVPYTLGGVSPFQQSFGGARCDSSGALAIRIADNAQITPTPSQWKFSVCDSTGAYCFNTTLTITGTSQNITANLQAAAVLIPITPFGNGVITLTNVAGATFDDKWTAAYTSCPSTGCEMYLPAGNYSATTCMLANTANKPVYLHGAGKGASIINFNHTGDGFCNILPINSSTRSMIFIANLTLNNTNNANTGGAIDQVGGTFFKVYNVQMTGYWKYCAIYDQTELAEFDLNDCEGLGTNQRGIWLVNGPDHTLGASTGFTNRISITRNQFNYGSGGIGVVDDGGQNHDITNNSFNGGGGVQLRLAGLTNGKIQTNNFEAGGSGGNAPLATFITTLNLGGGTGQSNGLDISSNLITSGGNYAIDASFIQSGKIEANQLYGSVANIRTQNNTPVQILANGQGSGAGVPVTDCAEIPGAVSGGIWNLVLFQENPASGSWRNTLGGVGTCNPQANWEIVAGPWTTTTGNGKNRVPFHKTAGGKGQNTTGTTGQTAGNGADYNITAGAGGDAPGGSTNGNGGNVNITAGAAGAGAGTAGVAGKVIVGSPTTIPSLALNGDSAMTAGPRMTFSARVDVLTGTISFQRWTPEKPITITAIEYQAITAGTTCATPPIIRVRNNTDSVDVTTITPANTVIGASTTGLSVNVAANKLLSLDISQAAAGCGVNWANVTVTVQYKMQ